MRVPLPGVHPADGPALPEDALAHLSKPSRLSKGVRAAAVVVSGAALASGLAAVTENGADPKPVPSASADLTPSASGPAETVPLPHYKAVDVHFAQLADTSPVSPADQAKSVADVKGALKAIDDAMNHKAGFTTLPVHVDTQTHMLPIDLQDANDSIKPTSDEILSDIHADNNDTLDVVVLDANGNVPPTVPVAHAHADKTGGDIVVYKDEKETVPVLAHELNHLLHYYHDQKYEVTPDGTTITLDYNTEMQDRGNTQTIAGGGALAPEMTDPDPLSGYELLRNGVIDPKQVATVKGGETLSTTITAVADATDGIKLIRLPLQPGTLRDVSAIMFELSDEDAEYTLKAYGAGETVADGQIGGFTSIIPLGVDHDRLGLGSGDPNKHMTIRIGSENIQFTLTELTAGDHPTAQLTVVRALG